MSATASIKYQNQTIALDDLRAGDSVNLKLAGDLINEITVTARAVTQYTGTIAALQNSVDSQTSIVRGGVAIGFGDLRYGQSVTYTAKLVGDQWKALTIQANN